MKVKDFIKWMGRTNPEAEVVFSIPPNEHNSKSTLLRINPRVALVYLGNSGDIFEVNAAYNSNSMAVVVN